MEVSDRVSPSRSQTLSLLDNAQDRMEIAVHERKVDMKYGLLQRISDPARHVHNATVLHKVKCSVEKRTKLTADILNKYFKQCRVYNVIILSLCPIKLFFPASRSTFQIPTAPKALILEPMSV
jgi:hypothetical protein